ncbi:AVAST type 1 anti-phage system MBL fold metallo-hydrolase Avs1a [Pseudomonas fluorescens]|uniref:MBL fold metallo-hydrolase n=1 Tax=Pseudomonas fluorescens TaxID=294 RepID=A0A944DLL6_PSEFL|nr:AVAST type 1 anti-phage system MBL fold metallo-hydrolase Avs1a [Pseudomonas fluorescens]MBT2298498.1 MBL fold metallo-hydrolase [Pseudomonas fluorescens]MBT2310023.1 MBL fold metallo-hydrolase [Pseudomonas fluorescens]MBT2311047.1 MBL fold metallo-hydrolase [Pseudomonas fluorescens]MBT2320018.1 MBL fold metallo-hydrolase [Pseudomonas fluorescens]MBT2328954.1 MBL fold metallo-hydrolase [Pseudomonas fluorescens]
MLKLKMYPANKGDAFLVNANGNHLLIDGGYASTYTDYIAQDLAELSRQGGRLSLVVCTHIDADHIGGLLTFFSTNGGPGNRGIDVDEVWHNSLRSLPCPATGPSLTEDTTVLEAIKRRGFPIPPEQAADPISARQGSSLAKLLRSQGYHWNFGDGSRCIDRRCATLDLPHTVQLAVLGPSVARLESLRTFWLKDMQKFGYRGAAQSSDLVDDAYEMWCAHAAQQPVSAGIQPIAANQELSLAQVYKADTWIANGSSIALLLKAGRSTVLLLGDAWAEDMVEELKCRQPESGPLLFDAIKIAHHGSYHNTSVELLALVDAPCFLISTNGKGRHGHPHFEVLKEIVDRPASFERMLYFNYETAASRRLRNYSSKSGARFSVHVVEGEWIDLGEAQL